MDYISIYGRVLNYKQDGPIELFYDDIERLRKFPEILKISKEIAEQRVFLHSYLNEIEMLIKKRYFFKASQLSDKIETELNKMKGKIEPEYFMQFYYWFAYAKISNGEYSKAIKYLNKVVNEFDGTLKPLIYKSAVQLQLIVHLNLKHYDLIPVLMNKAMSFSKKQDLQGVTDTQIFLFFKNICKNFNNKIFKNELLILQSTMDNEGFEFSKSKFLFNLPLWIEASLQTKLMCDLGENQNI